MSHCVSVSEAQSPHLARPQVQNAQRAVAAGRQQRALALHVREVADEIAVLRVPRDGLALAAARVDELDRAVVRACIVRRLPC